MTLNRLLTPATLKAHRATWWVYVGITGQSIGRERIRHTAKMRGRWPGYDVTCSCGWDSKTGGATRGSVENDLWDHRYSAQCAADN